MKKLTRMYRIEMVETIEDEYEESFRLAYLIVPEQALGDHQFQSAEYVGDLDSAFALLDVKTIDDSNEKGDNVVPIKKD